ncbi:MAG TPA: sugar phosphate nucleotidyltransferase [Methylomirabilota bacterium]|nr:sugar phosphate nucleotidyltransferase [Methylomirabilota bacterium]
MRDDGQITRFDEKPVLDDWVNGGFFVYRWELFDFLADDDVLEGAPLERLAKDGQLMAFRHTGFWACMDTYKDALTLNELWVSGEPPWRVW